MNDAARPRPMLAINHVGLGVPNLEDAIDWYGRLFGFRLISNR